jgi:anti-sigma regulatory factor (Ser/Thr protein kinase)
MSASLTAMLTTSFCNYQVENLHLWSSFTLRIFLARFQEYLSSILLEEEALSCGFFLVDLVNEKIETALFGLPPVLLRCLDGSVRKLLGENPPLGIYPSEVKSSMYNLSDIADLLIMTDGVSDAELIAGGSYRQELVTDFKAAPTLAALQRRFKEKTDQEALDDLTLLHLQRLDFNGDWNWRVEPDLTLAGLGAAIQEFLDALVIEAGLVNVERDELEVSLTEALTNALEHGCLGVDRAEKAALMMSGEYEEALLSKQPLPQAGIIFSATLWRGAETPLLLLEIKDNGPGLPKGTMTADCDEAAVNGRGLRMIRHYTDSVFIGEKGGHLIVLKTLERRNDYAD